MASTKSDAAARSFWDRIAAPTVSAPASAPASAPQALADGERLPRHVRQDAQQAARSYGVSVHVYRTKGGQYRGVTADDPVNIGRLDKVATRITTIHPPKGAATHPGTEEIPREVWARAEKEAAKLKVGIVIFLTKSREFRGVSEDDAAMLAHYRGRARELVTVPAPVLRAPKKAEEVVAPAPTLRAKRTAKNTATPARVKQQRKRAPASDKPAVAPALMPVEPITPVEVEAPATRVKAPRRKPTTPEASPRRSRAVTRTVVETNEVSAPIPQEEDKNLAEAEDGMNRLELLLKQALQS